MKIVVNVVLLSLTLHGTEGVIDPDRCTLLLSSNHSCPKDKLVYTCSTFDGVLSWDIGETVYRYTSQDYAALHPIQGVTTNLTADYEDMGVHVLESTLTISSGSVANESNISCKNNYVCTKYFFYFKSR